MTHTITITKLRRPQCHGMITHQVILPGWRRPVGVGSIDDARKTAAGFQPPAGDTVEIVESDPAAAKHAARAAALALAPSGRVPV